MVAKPAIEGTINVPFDKLGALNKTLKGKEYKRTPIESGGGYAAQVEVLHQLHCVVCDIESISST